MKPADSCILDKVSLVTYDISAGSVLTLARLRTFSQEFKCIAQQFDCVRHVISGV